MKASLHKVSQKFLLTDDERKTVTYCTLQPCSSDHTTWDVLRSLGAKQPMSDGCQLESILWDGDFCIVTWKVIE